MIGISEQDLRMFCHNSFEDNVENTLLSIKQDFPNFLNRGNKTEASKEENQVIVVEGEFEEDSKEAIEIALNYIGNEINIEKCIFAVRMIYENFHEEGDASAYKYIEGILFRLYELKYYMLPSDSNVDRLKYTTDNHYYTQCNHRYKAVWDTEEAIEIFEKAEQYLKKEEYAKAAECYKQAALLGNTDAQFEYAVSVYQGEGCVADALESAFWHWIAAGNGNEKSMMNLGVFYREGSGVKQSLSQMTYWYARSAERLQPNGVFNLGRSIKLGELVEKNQEIGTILMQSIKMLDNQEVKEFVQGVAGEIIRVLEKAVYNIPL